MRLECKYESFFFQKECRAGRLWAVRMPPSLAAQATLSRLIMMVNELTCY